MWLLYVFILVVILGLPYVYESFETDPSTMNQIQKGTLMNYDRTKDNIISQQSRLDDLQSQMDTLTQQTSQFQAVSADNDPASQY